MPRWPQRPACLPAVISTRPPNKTVLSRTPLLPERQLSPGLLVPRDGRAMDASEVAEGDPENTCDLEQPQRGSNPCLHLERVLVHVFVSWGYVQLPWLWPFFLVRGCPLTTAFARCYAHGSRTTVSSTTGVPPIGALMSCRHGRSWST